MSTIAEELRDKADECRHAGSLMRSAAEEIDRLTAAAEEALQHVPHDSRAQLLRLVDERQAQIMRAIAAEREISNLPTPIAMDWLTETELRTLDVAGLGRCSERVFRRLIQQAEEGLRLKAALTQIY